ncbi:hypothetical protein BJ322DRAFT_217425 [Thelephora terrestris]|uniref:Uncharacterized protein n=1 Tax=Thelephora terrestris TaxID=56493 RepID=A0A9P6H9M2_9AGAM|nr:hypothetical protein BJ322DRAFT_217425 [Thelephora terrestris]
MVCFFRFHDSANALLELVPGYSSEALIDLSNATKLREVAFWFRPDVNWITYTLETILPEHRDLQKILIYFEPYNDISADDPISADDDDPADLKKLVGEEIYKQWMDLDGRLVRLWEAHAVRTKLIGVRNKFRFVIGLLPETKRRGIIQLGTYADEQPYG